MMNRCCASLELERFFQISFFNCFSWGKLIPMLLEGAKRIINVLIPGFEF